MVKPRILRAFAEVIFSTNELVLAECYKESAGATVCQGSLVKIKSAFDKTTFSYGIITKINNTSLDAIHKPSALGLDLAELEQLHPQVQDLLKKQIEIYLFAHSSEENNILLYSPLKPMMIHDFVYEVTDGELLSLTDDISNIISLLKKNQINPSILIELINTAYKLRNYNNEFLLNIGKKISVAFTDDIELLMQVLKRLALIRTST